MFFSYEFVIGKHSKFRATHGMCDEIDCMIEINALIWIEQNAQRSSFYVFRFRKMEEEEEKTINI